MDALTVVTCLDETALDAARAELQSLCVALAECPPLRVRLVRHRLGDIVMLNVNHAAGDAFGAVRFLRSIARAYAGEADPRPDIDLTASRDLRSLLLARDVHTRLGRLLLLLQKTSDLVTVPARVAKHGGVDRPGYGIHQVRLSLEQTQALNSLGDGARVNNVLVAALHVAIALWNIEHGVRCGRISVLMPVNLRPAHLRAEMVGNFSLMVRVLTTPEQRSLGRVVLTVTDQVQRMKNGDTLAALIELLARTASLPIWAKRVAPAVLAITGNRLVDTAQLATSASWTSCRRSVGTPARRWSCGTRRRRGCRSGSPWGPSRRQGACIWPFVIVTLCSARTGPAASRTTICPCSTSSSPGTPRK